MDCSSGTVWVPQVLINTYAALRPAIVRRASTNASNVISSEYIWMTFFALISGTLSSLKDPIHYRHLYLFWKCGKRDNEKEILWGLKLLRFSVLSGWVDLLKWMCVMELLPLHYFRCPYTVSFLSGCKSLSLRPVTLSNASRAHVIGMRHHWITMDFIVISSSCQDLDLLTSE